MPVYYHYQSVADIEELKGKTLPVLPVGSIEQHCTGPLGLDALIAEALAARSCLLAENRGVTCLILPTLYYGFSPEWRGGTITLRTTTLVDIISDIASSLSREGLDKLAIINGHGGNSGILEAAAREASARTGVTIAVIDYWRLAGVRLGHCDKQEEELLRGLLGLTSRCECPLKAHSKPYRITASNPPGTGLESQSWKSVGEIVRAVADAIVDFASYNGGPVL
ncbi:MAG: creatininase family protein [Desulfurococcales archaeon]|nr:creatininase family protein [Desulfurococcales archaeon]